MASTPRTYEIVRTFDVPLDFAYRWCTDFTPEDRRLQGEKGYRKLIRKTARTVVYEDLTDSPNGWMWSRQTVTLRPPDGWRAIAAGNYRTWKLQHMLRPMAANRTQFTLRGERRATTLGGRNPTRSAMEHELHTMWRNLGRAMERDYRARRTGRSR
jgi:hypothetical protein